MCKSKKKMLKILLWHIIILWILDKTNNLNVACYVPITNDATYFINNKLHLIAKIYRILTHPAIISVTTKTMSENYFSLHDKIWRISILMVTELEFLSLGPGFYLLWSKWGARRSQMIAPLMRVLWGQESIKATLSGHPRQPLSINIWILFCCLI